MIAIVPPENFDAAFEAAEVEGVNVLFLLGEDGSLLEPAESQNNSGDVEEVLSCLDRFCDLHMIERRIQGRQLIYFVPAETIPKVVAQLHRIARRTQTLCL